MAEAQPVGVWWDAVRVPASVGERALRLLGEQTGAVIADPPGIRLYWLIGTGAADAWDHGALQPVHLLRAHSFLVVPPAHRVTGPGVHWRLRPTADRRLTEPRALHTALRIALTLHTQETP
ncbi:hypothetical protein RKE29_09230 [Streptomyces sp. B1866]|uniref:hypothetical protein n=1 Tax=Streptomyces sp. B1866 TaxID=3075431 RepID=UPI002890AD81|nr:hypothetical protein [Streptomyces sp. B1866]MDT3396822.1 hypothetical protein [Streptomyces sp. B1866]